MVLGLRSILVWGWCRGPFFCVCGADVGRCSIVWGCAPLPHVATLGAGLPRRAWCRVCEAVGRCDTLSLAVPADLLF